MTETDPPSPPPPRTARPSEGASERPGAQATAAPRGERPLLSLLVLGFNQERHTRAVVEAAFAQTYAPLEIVLSDDASHDRTFAIMQEMAAGYRGPHRVVLNRNPRNLGIVGNVNRLMELSQGALVIKNDGDDVSEPQRAERIAQAWEASGREADLLFSAVTRIDEGGAERGVLRLADQGQLGMRALAERPTPYDVVRGNLFVLGAATAWSRRLFDVFGPIDEAAVVEDSVIPFRAAALSGIAYIDEPLVRYRIAGGITGLEAGRSRGFEKMYGRRIKLNRIQMQSKKAILRDLERAPVAVRDGARCAQECRHYVARMEHLLAMVEASHARRLASLPGATLRTLRRRDPFFAYIALKYLFDGLAMRVTDWRGGGR